MGPSPITNAYDEESEAADNNDNQGVRQPPSQITTTTTVIAPTAAGRITNHGRHTMDVAEEDIEVQVGAKLRTAGGTLEVARLQLAMNQGVHQE